MYQGSRQTNPGKSPSTEDLRWISPRDGRPGGSGENLKGERIERPLLSRKSGKPCNSPKAQGKGKGLGGKKDFAAKRQKGGKINRPFCS